MRRLHIDVPMPNFRLCLAEHACFRQIDTLNRLCCHPAGGESRRCSWPSSLQCRRARNRTRMWSLPTLMPVRTKQALIMPLMRCKSRSRAHVDAPAAAPSLAGADCPVPANYLDRGRGWQAVEKLLRDLDPGLRGARNPHVLPLYTPVPALRAHPAEGRSRRFSTAC
jgi:hypothetical protein